MYNEFFGLSTRPFALTPDPAFLYQSRQHQMALNMLEYGLESQAPLLLLTGEIGSGKTTLLRRLIRDLGDSVMVGLISQTHSRTRSMLAWATSALEIVTDGESDIELYEALAACTVREYARGRRTLLIVDEAQNLGEDVIEELRLLSNMNSEKDLVLQILLVGQPELRQILSKPSMRQIAQRVAADYHLRALKEAETEGYIGHRLIVAGGSPDLFTPDAMAIIHARSGGVPRLINQLCDMSLVYAYADSRKKVDASVVNEVLADRESSGALPLFVSADSPTGPVATGGAESW